MTDHGLDFVLSRMMNLVNSAEGSNLPPRQRGEFRVPFVTNFRIARIIPGIFQTQYILTWENPENPRIGHYNIYIVNVDTNSPPLGPFTSQVSPATITIQAPIPAHLTIYVQTVMKNGFTSDLLTGPTCGTVTSVV